MRSHTIFGVRVDDVSTEEVRATFKQWIAGDGQHLVVTPNPEFLLFSRRDRVFYDTLVRADLSLPDGVGLRFAVPALCGARLRHRVTGVAALEMLTGQAKRLVLIGGSPEVGNKVAKHLGATWIGVGRVGDDGALSITALEEIRAAAPDVVAAALGGQSGKQEKCLARHLSDWPSVKIAIGVGGAFDMLAGERPRAPAWLRRIGLEWLWRVAIEPQRWRRIINAVLVFPAIVVWTTLREHRFLQACRHTIPEIFRQLLAR